MITWLKKRFTPPESPSASVDDALAALRALDDETKIEATWDLLDTAVDGVDGAIADVLGANELDVLPHNAAAIWLLQRKVLRGDALNNLAEVGDLLTWALPFEQNQVLLGAALCLIDGIAPEKREQVATDVFDRAGAEHWRRFWLLLKVRSPDFVAKTLTAFDAHDTSERQRFRGAFRQFRSEDFDLLASHFSESHPAADLILIGLWSSDAARAETFRTESAASGNALLRETAATLA